MTAYIKYEEGFQIDFGNGTTFKGLSDYNFTESWVEDTIHNLNGLKCITKPAALYTTPGHAAIITSAGILLNFTWTTKTSALFLLMSNWNHLFSKLTKKTFMSTVEFKIYISYSVISFFLYPTLQLIFINNSTLTTIAPQFLQNIEYVTIGILAEITNYRFRKAKRAFGENMAGTFDFWITMNHCLAIAVWMGGVFLCIINSDIVGGWMVIYHNKFWTDLLSVWLNMGESMPYAIVIYLLFRKDKSTKGETTQTLTGKSSAKNSTLELTKED